MGSRSQRPRTLRLQAWQVCHGRWKAGHCGRESAEQSEGPAILNLISHFSTKNKGRQRLQKSPHTFCLKNLLLLAGQDTIVSGNKDGALIQREARDSKRL